MSLKERRDKREILSFSTAGRRSEIALFSGALGNQPLDYNILNICGVGGVGKSSLANYYRYMCGERGIQCAFIDCHSARLPHSAMEIIREQFDGVGAKQAFLEFDKYILRFHGIRSKLRAAGDRVSTGAISLIKNGLPLGIGHAIVDGVGDQGIKDIVGKYLPHEDVIFLEKSQQILTSSLVDGINKITVSRDRGFSKQKFVLIFDTYEDTDQRFDDWMRQGLLDSELDEDRTIIVIAGQDELGTPWRKWDGLIRRVELVEFDEQASISLMRDNQIFDSDLQQWILQETNGFPYALAMMAELYTSGKLNLVDKEGGSQTHAVLENVVERYLRRVTDETVRDLINVCSTLRTFNKDILRSISSHPLNDEAFAKLIHTKHIVRLADDGSYHIPGYIRRYISKRFESTSPSQWRAAHAKASEYYQRLFPSITSPKEWSETAFNYLYHRLSVERDQKGLSWFFPAEYETSYLIDYFRPSDTSDILKIDYAIFGNNPRGILDCQNVTDDELNPNMANESTLLELYNCNPDMLRVVRDKSKRAIGYSCVIPLTEAGRLRVLAGDVLYYGLSMEYVERTLLIQSDYYYIDIIALLDPTDYRAGAILLRDLISRINPGAQFISTMPNTEIGFELMKRLGFERQDAIRIKTYTGERHLYTVDMIGEHPKSAVTFALKKRPAR